MKKILTLSLLAMTLNANITLPSNFKSSFIQTITNDNGKVISYNGNVIFNNMKEEITNLDGSKESVNQNLFKWNYVKPTKKEVCTDGVQLIVVDHDLEQVSHYIMDGGINLEEILKVAKKITNRTYQATYKEIEYIITLDNNQKLNKIVYVDNMENGVKIIFKNMSYNSSSFDFKSLDCNAPSGYDIIEG